MVQKGYCKPSRTSTAGYTTSQMAISIRSNPLSCRSGPCRSSVASPASERRLQDLATSARSSRAAARRPTWIAMTTSRSRRPLACPAQEPASCGVVHGGKMKCRHEPSILQTNHELFPTHTVVMRCIAQPLRGGAPQQRGPVTPQTQTRPNRLHTHTHPPKRLAHPRSPIPPLSTLTSRATPLSS